MERKCCCSKEQTGTVPIKRVMDKLDALAARDDADEMERVLDYWESEAKALGDDKGLLEILSEEIGFFRNGKKRERCLRAIDEATGLLAVENENSVPLATIHLNIATSLKAFDKLDEAMPHYEVAKRIYESKLEKDDFRLAGLFNNYASALTDLGDLSGAEENYKKAIDIILSQDEPQKFYPELAITYVNLAGLEYAKETVDDDKVDAYVEKARLALDDERVERDGNYASVCRKCADSFGFFGYFALKEEFATRAQKVFSEHK